MAVQVSLADGQTAYISTQLLHLTDFLHICVAVADLTAHVVLVRHEFKCVGHIANISVELRHVLVQVQGEQ